MAAKTGTKKSSPAKKAGRRKSAAKRTIRKAAHNVELTADRARELSAALIRAGELVGQGAAFLESMAQRTKK